MPTKWRVYSHSDDSVGLSIPFILPAVRAQACTGRSSIRSRSERRNRAYRPLPGAPAHIEGIDPELILKVTLVSPVQEDTWRTAAFKVLAQGKGGILVLFKDGVELKLFRERIDHYKKGASEDQKNPAYNTLFSAIEDVGSLTPEDRIRSNSSTLSAR
jgi:hypothetical protein